MTSADPCGCDGGCEPDGDWHWHDVDEVDGHPRSLSLRSPRSVIDSLPGPRRLPGRRDGVTGFDVDTTIGVTNIDLAAERLMLDVAGGTWSEREVAEWLSPYIRPIS